MMQAVLRQPYHHVLHSVCNPTPEYQLGFLLFLVFSSISLYWFEFVPYPSIIYISLMKIPSRCGQRVSQPLITSFLYDAIVYVDVGLILAGC